MEPIVWPTWEIAQYARITTFVRKWVTGRDDWNGATSLSTGPQSADKALCARAYRYFHDIRE